MFRVGTGFDVHRLVEGRELFLGGTKIEHEKGLLGHSDADVLIHAIMDCLLGAASLPDVGVFFPDDDSKWEDASSIDMLAEVSKLLEGEEYEICNIDATIICQEPKLSPYRLLMIENIAGVLGMDKGSVNVKATTTEGLGFPGEKEGIAAQAICLLKRR